MHKFNNVVQQRVSGWGLIGILALLLVACPLLANLKASTTTVTSHEVSASAVSTSPPVAPPTTASIVPQIAPGDWPSYLLNNGGFNSNESRINPATAPHLKLYWTHQARGAISVQPVETNGIIYWGSWDGYEHATALDGKRVWATHLGKTIDNNPRCAPSSVGVASTATVAPVTIAGTTRLVVFVGGGNANFYALDASNGHVIWKTSLGSSPEDFIWSSPAVYNGSVYIGRASFGDCPSVQGELIQMNITTGAVQNIFKVVPDGCAGGGVWGSPTIDTSTGDLYIATGDIRPCNRQETYAVAVVQLHASNLAVVGSWQVPLSNQVNDSDFGSTPTLFTATIGGVSRPLVGVVNKNGVYYAFTRGALSKGPVWSVRISTAASCSSCDGPGTIAPSAWDGVRLYVGSGETTIHGQTCQGSVRALDPATGHFIWERCLQGGYRVLAPVTVVPGVVVVAEGPYIFAFNATTGDTLFTYEDAHNGTAFYGGPTIAHGMLYVGNMDGNLYALEPDHFD